MKLYKIAEITPLPNGGTLEETENHKTWKKNGKLHREDGPAIERSDGTKGWYLNGKRHTKEEFKTQIQKNLINEIKDIVNKAKNKNEKINTIPRITNEKIIDEISDNIDKLFENENYRNNLLNNLPEEFFNNIRMTPQNREIVKNHFNLHSINLEDYEDIFSKNKSWYKRANRMFETFGLPDKLVNSFTRHYNNWKRNSRSKLTPQQLQKLYEKQKQFHIGGSNITKDLEPIFQRHGYPQGIEGHIPKRIQFIIVHPKQTNAKGHNAFFMVLPSNDFIIAKVESNINNVNFDYDFTQTISHELQHFLKSLYEGKKAPQYAYKNKKVSDVSDLEYYSDPWEIQTFALNFASDAIDLIKSSLQARIQNVSPLKKQQVLENMKNTKSKYVGLAIQNAKNYLEDTGISEKTRKEYYMATIANFNKLFDNIIKENELV